MQDEGIRGTVLSIAQATKARPNQGKVISQIRWITKSGTINPEKLMYLSTCRLCCSCAKRISLANWNYRI